MNHKQLLLWLLWFFPLYTNACDMCGCFMGITPYDNQSSIQVLHRYRAFNGYYGQNQEHMLFPVLKSGTQPGMGGTAVPNQTTHMSHTDGTGAVYSNNDYEVYQTTELRAKYFLHQRVELNAFIPLNNYQSLSGNATHTHTVGLGDITLYSGFHLLRKIEVEGAQHRLIIGAGLKLPTGKFNAMLSNGRVPLMLQTGTGSTDIFVMANYILGIKKFGMSITSSFKLNGTNKYNERILPSTTHYLNLFLKLKKGNWMFIPAVQNYYEYTGGMMVDNNLMTEARMNVLFTGLGMDIFYKNLGLTTSFQFKTLEQMTTNKLAGTSRLAVGLTYNFKQTNYLVKRKKLQQ